MSTLITIQGSDRVTDSRADINANFAALNTDKAETTGNVATATALATPRGINGVLFDGTADIQVSNTLRKGLVLHLPMDFSAKNGTTFYDAAVAANSGTATLTGAYSATDGPDATGAQLFDGVDDYIEVPHHVNQLLVNGFTICAWIKATSAGEGGTGVIFDKSTGTSGQGGIKFNVGSGCDIACRVNGGTNRGSGTNSLGSFNDGIWRHGVVTCTAAGLLNFYINGVQSGNVDQSTGACSGITTTNAPRIGNRSTATDRSFDGSLTKIRVYSRILSASEVLELYTLKI